jgi:hypothetical protein
MKLRNKTLIALGVLALGFCGLAFVVYVAPIAIDIYTSLRNYNQRIASQSDYTKITTSLPRNVVDDICSKFELETDDARCVPDSVVYGPDFFDHIKTYLNNLPDEEATLETVQDKLETYLVLCENPDNKGYYACRYDLRGDGIYPILIFFTKEDHIYRIIANTSGS